MREEKVGWKLKLEKELKEDDEDDEEDDAAADVGAAASCIC